MYLIDIHRTLYPKSTEYKFFLAPHHTYSKIDHIIGSKSLLSKCKRMEIIITSLSDHSAVKLECRIKLTHNNINLKCKWAKCPSQKTQTGKLDKKSKPISVLYSGNPSHVQRHTYTQNNGMEKDLPSK